MRIALACLAALLLTAAPALAEDPPAAPPKPTPEAIAAARKAADTLIAESGGADLFTNEVGAEDDTILVRHTASNFQCEFWPGKDNRLSVITKVLPRGDDIGCSTTASYMRISFFVTRSPQTTKQAFNSAVDAFKRTHLGEAAVKPRPDAMPPLAEDAYKDMPQTETAWFLTMAGFSSFDRISVTRVGDWVVTMRMTAPADVAGPAIGLSEMIWLIRIKEMLPKTGSAGTP